MKTAEEFLEEKGIDHIEIVAYHFTDESQDDSENIDVLELIKSYAKEHAIEFLAFYEKFAGILDPMSDEYKNGVYTEWINQ